MDLDWIIVRCLLVTDALKQEICDVCASFFARGYAFGSTGNLSVRSGDDIWVTPTGGSFRHLTPGDLACLALDGSLKSGRKPSKESPFHLGCYRAAGDRARAIVHLHSTYCVALSCLDEPNPVDRLPALTPYFFMRVAPVAVVPYLPPGSAELGAAVEEAARDHNSILLRNHGLIAIGRSLAEAVDRAEEFEETAKLAFVLRGEAARTLTPDQIAGLSKWK